ncbi:MULTISPECIES: YolD-like family protein [Thermoactinomyces]|jgi:hypothetical protein|uniref:YolD-like family protein n=1 Tax=Thermoactinomyces daqus TaxID=1329516 RepID=A0A7W1XBM5_9BACL|nr:MULTISPECIES: YolD-like family protein [Thermoactinomyces]MBA4543626.1 YolD-like family protein [Thermoactinomyces daqus]MBH8597076.1 YolD-like family protein [Thermoactinomyces sp. CICC 10523]MBH8606253.1 YolD-like family protein [Thermoactinomyces sp. CICC 10521]
MSEILDRKNMLWEGSRMFLPEHRQALAEQRARADDFIPPELDDDRWDEINRLILEALHSDFPLLIRYVENRRPRERCGFIQKIIPHERRLCLADGRHLYTISFADIYDVEPVSGGD